MNKQISLSNLEDELSQVRVPWNEWAAERFLISVAWNQAIRYRTEIRWEDSEIAIGLVLLK